MKIRVVLIIVPLLILALALAGGSILMLRLFFLSVLVLLLSYLWVLLSIRGIEGQTRKSQEYCQVGKWFDEEITVSNRSKLPKLLVRLWENTDLPGYDNRLALNLPPRSSRTWRVKVPCQRRGRYSLGSLTATVSDPFGFFSWCRNLGEPQSILIYPMTSELPFFQPLSRSELGHTGGPRSINEISPNAAHVREYVGGDTLNHIHWRSTAHIGKLMVKTFEPDRSHHASQNFWIIPDMHQASQLGDGDGATEEYGVIIAASLVKKYIDSGQQVGLMASGDQTYVFPPQMGNQHLWSMLEALALMKATGEVPIDQLISHGMERFGVNATIIVITPSTSERIAASLRQIKTYGNMVIAILLESVSFGGTVSAVNVIRPLISNGIQVYVIRRGEELARALDSRALTYYTR